ncbi:AbrB family transcriptional regulator [Thermococci archaeon]|uniref:AbrB/MazE/SpoVT family DNA-binding domain-containing protein n=1 Tax=Palaeococcus sp. (in: euryarchaeotes) TaxID=2820298 RepID=UPI000F2089C6|nr:AbrB/MazE/SpoVT family DNA-binding domain-containing protein [Palaeococcus sp. (in: euryarchaeotes)]MCD6559896.1 AbrB/MazE/SpoVT family DNA-binding domain-containing protein [Palaeococcus sp. (in: euryarchaeotes)]RLF74549.1 MAG: AbrB family transcriptional regulator [Thermococci archaeon]RLF89123.1 MAG: AbrB family transcriptional regulator [Thermococci archaeon]
MISKVDSRGRLYIPKSMRSKVGSEVYLVETPNGILIIPKPEDPLKELEELGKSLPEVSPEKLKGEILKQALEELK